MSWTSTTHVCVPGSSSTDVIAAVLESDDHQRLYMGLSLLVSAAARRARGPRAARLRRADGVLRPPRAAPATSATTSANRSRARSPSCAIRRSSCARSTPAPPRRRPPARTRHGSPASSPRRSSSTRTRRRGADLRMRRACLAALILLAGCGGALRGPVRGQALRRRRQREPHAARLRRRHRHLQRRQTHADPERDPAARPRARARPVRAGRAAPGAAARPEGRAHLPRADAGGTLGFADTSRPLPDAFARLTAFTSDVTERELGSFEAEMDLVETITSDRSPVAAARTA